MVDLLLARGADVNVADTYYEATPLVWAVGAARRDRALAAAKGRRARRTLVSAAGAGRAGIVTLILQRGKLGPEALSDA